MTVQIEPESIRKERRRRGWSQLHLATVSGLGLRTVQRIEQGGAASYESAQALAACLEIPLEGLLARPHARPPEPPPRPRGVVTRRAAALGMASSFVAGALLMTMHGVVAEDLFIDLGVSLSGADDEYRTPIFLVDGERSEISLPAGYRIAITPRLGDDQTVRLEFELYDDSRQPADLIARPAVLTMNGREFRIVQGAARPSDEPGSNEPVTNVLDIKGVPVLLDDARRNGSTAGDVPAGPGR